MRRGHSANGLFTARGACSAKFYRRVSIVARDRRSGNHSGSGGIETAGKLVLTSKKLFPLYIKDRAGRRCQWVKAQCVRAQGAGTVRGGHVTGERGRAGVAPLHQCSRYGVVLRTTSVALRRSASNRGNAVLEMRFNRHFALTLIARTFVIFIFVL